MTKPMYASGPLGTFMSTQLKAPGKKVTKRAARFRQQAKPLPVIHAMIDDKLFTITIRVVSIETAYCVLEADKANCYRLSTIARSFKGDAIIITLDLGRYPEELRTKYLSEAETWAVEAVRNELRKS
jgi:hypothetical protein